VNVKLSYLRSLVQLSIIPPNHEEHMKLVIRYIGPIAVGFNGADPSYRTVVVYTIRVIVRRVPITPYLLLDTVKNLV
jgi:hypothetical protein